MCYRLDAVREGESDTLRLVLTLPMRPGPASHADKPPTVTSTRGLLLKAVPWTSSRPVDGRTQGAATVARVEVGPLIVALDTIPPGVLHRFEGRDLVYGRGDDLMRPVSTGVWERVDRGRPDTLCTFRLAPVAALAIGCPAP